MKNILQILMSVFLFAVIAGFSSCSKTITVDYNLADMAACMPASTGYNDSVFTFQLNDSSLVSLLKSNGVTQLNRVNSLGLKQITVAVVTTGATLNSIEAMQVYYKSVNSLQDSAQIAYADSIPAGATSLVLKIDGASLLSALSSNSVITFNVLVGPSGTAPICLKLTSGIIEIDAKD